MPEPEQKLAFVFFCSAFFVASEPMVWPGCFKLRQVPTWALSKACTDEWHAPKTSAFLWHAAGWQLPRNAGVPVFSAACCHCFARTRNFF